MTRKLSAAVAIVLTVFLVLPGAASAHRENQSYVYLTISTDQMTGEVQYGFEEVEEIFGIELGGDRDANVVAVASVETALLAHVDEHFDIGADGEVWAVEYGEIKFLTDDFDVDRDYVVVPFEAVLPAQYDEVPQVIEVYLDPFFDELDGRDAELLIANDYDRGVFENEQTALVLFDGGSRFQEVDLGDASRWKNFTTSIELGVDHIRTGPDHIFFVFVLLLPSVLIYKMSRWWPVERFGSSLWRVLKLVTMFTIAHSVTFTLAGLDILPLPSSKLVETIIALSIAAAALNNVWPVLPNREWVIAGAFGLFHGMGFAGLVSDLQIDRTTQLVSLLGRNVGIEIGQAIIVLISFPMLFLIRRTIYYRPLFVIASVGMAIVSIGWMFERMFEEDLGYNGLIDRVVEWPRALVVIGVLTAIAAAIQWFEASRGRLLPYYEEETADAADGESSDGDTSDDEAVLV